MNDEVSFGQWVRRRRKSLDLTQKQLADRVGCATATIVKIEADERRPSREIAQLLARHLEIPPDEQVQFIQVARGEHQVAALAVPVTNATSIPQAVLSTSTSHLPAPLTPLVGRERELDTIQQMLHDPQCRLLTLTGPGGIGKTRLALETAWQLADHLDTSTNHAFVDGIHFVSLAPIGSPKFVVSALAEVLGLALSGSGDPFTQLLTYLHARQLLLVLDNFEHLIASAETVAELLGHAPHIKLLITSRERLNLRGEWVLEVQGLPVPPECRSERLESYSAILLFLQCARRMQPEFLISSDECPHLVRICQIVEGMPLGIELAAAWVRMLSCAEIAQEIQRHLDFLTSAARDMPERHRSLQAVMDHSWNLLSADEQRMLDRLSVFQGGFQRQAAEQVAGATLPLLSGLVDKSLVRRTETGRYDLHELVRQYAHEQLIRSGDFDEARDQHLKFFLNLVKEAEPNLREADQLIWLDRLEQDHDNLRAALEWSLNNDTTTPAALRMAGALYVFWQRRDHWSEGRMWLQRALILPANMTATPERADALNAAARLAAEQIDVQAARELGEENLTLSQALSDSRRTACALNSLGFVLWKQKDHAAARASCMAGLSLFREQGDRFAMADALHTLGHVTINQADYAAAQSYLEESLALYRELDNKIGAAEAWGDLGLLAYLRSDYAAAGPYLEESLETFREINSLPGIEAALNRLGDLARCHDDYPLAERLYEESLKLNREMGDKDEIPSLLHNLGCVALNREDYGQAIDLFKEGLAIQQDIANQAGIAECLTGIAGALIGQGEAERGARLLGAAEVLRESIGVTLWPANRIEYDRILSRLRKALDKATLAAAWAKGRARPMQEVIEIVLPRNTW